MAKISRTTPNSALFAVAVLAGAVGVALTAGAVFIVDRLVVRLIGDGSVGVAGLVSGAFILAAAVVTWGQEPSGSSLSGIFGGQIASPRSRRGRGEMNRIWLTGALCLAAVLTAVLGWAS